MLSVCLLLSFAVSFAPLGLAREVIDITVGLLPRYSYTYGAGLLAIDDAKEAGLLEFIRVRLVPTSQLSS